MPPRIDELTRERVREALGQLYANGEPLGNLQGLWTEPEIVPPSDRRYIDPRLFGERPAYQTVGIDFSGFGDSLAFVTGFNDALRAQRAEDAEYKKTLDKQWNELMFGQAQ